MKKELIFATLISIWNVIFLVITNLDELTETKIFIKIIIGFIVSFGVSFLLIHLYLKKAKKQ